MFWLWGKTFIIFLAPEHQKYESGCKTHDWKKHYLVISKSTFCGGAGSDRKYDKINYYKNTKIIYNYNKTLEELGINNEDEITTKIITDQG